MATIIEKPMTIQATGQPPKRIEEFIGRVNSNATGGQHCPNKRLVRARRSTNTRWFFKVVFTLNGAS